MTRKTFLADVASASEKSISNVSKVVRGDDDGDVNFVFTAPTGATIAIALLAIDVSSYPADNNFMIFTNSPDVPSGVNAALEDIASLSAGMRVEDLLNMITTRLQTLFNTNSTLDPLIVDDDDMVMVDSQELNNEEAEEDTGDEDEDEDEDFDYSDDDDAFGAFDNSHGNSSSRFQHTEETAASLNQRIRNDLRTLKFANFKFGILAGMKADSHTCLLSISVQAAKLGLSEEALQAWDLRPQQYIVLLIKYSAGYKPFDALISEPAHNARISFRIGVCEKYRPSASAALAAFTDMSKDKPLISLSQGGSNSRKSSSTLSTTFNSIFISSSLNEFMNEKFISLLKIRKSMGLGWDGAKLFFNDNMGKQNPLASHLPPHYFDESTPKQTSLPGMVLADHLLENHSQGHSFPLIAAQFALRSLLRCTEFCLVCHDKIEGDFEALKPYVCDKPLCLYQYMALGFGPSIEHAILTQPYVVDLLISFCFVAALNQRIREYPVGMSLSVPPVMNSITVYKASMQPTYGQAKPPEPASPPQFDSGPESIEIKFDFNRRQILFDKSTICPIHRGDWVIISHAAQSLHFRVEDTAFYPNVQLAETSITARIDSSSPVFIPITPETPDTTPPPNTFEAARMSIYNRNFDEMTTHNKAETIVMLLQTLPSVPELRKYLLSQSKTTEPNLRLWKDHISPAALGLLRWIIASNRSCIVQVDKCPGQTDDDLAASNVRLDQKCSNIAGGWVQFRLAQGSPDKEQRFLNALKAQQTDLNPIYPTIFAFHGSPLQNWHSIIRHGLDFGETLHGRAFGNGVYHAIDQNVSTGYAQSHTSYWPGSELKFNSAMSLNEIVNCPTKFQSHQPYLVVQYVDWIQCRYLFVQTNTTDSNDMKESTNDEVMQDPKFTARSTIGKAVGIPQCTVSISKAFRTNNSDPEISAKRRKPMGASCEYSEIISDEDEAEDVAFLLSDNDAESKKKATERPKASMKCRTDFVPGSLDQATLPMLEPPAYATPSATMRLNRELKAILKIQESTPSHELGWYINPDLVSNVYQWIVELHSFEDELPLAKDMKKAGVASVVLEIRFGKDFPHSPPFVRVIRPRFLPFTMGGGGHVTMGGAMCMELLTNSGWSAVSSIESVLLQVRLAIMNLEPKPARLMMDSKHQVNDYGTGEAIDAYIRACKAHGWEVPKDFMDFGASGASRY